mgnify:CR=1 FL=1
MAITQKTDTLKEALNRANPGDFPNAMNRIQFGDMISPIDETITLATVAATVDLSVLSSKKLPALIIQSLRVTDVTGGTGAAGQRTISDPGASASATVTKLSADGKTLTFEGTIKALRIMWIPRSAIDLAEAFAIA